MEERPNNAAIGNEAASPATTARRARHFTFDNIRQTAQRSQSPAMTNGAASGTPGRGNPGREATRAMPSPLSAAAGNGGGLADLSRQNEALRRRVRELQAQLGQKTAELRRVTRDNGQFRRCHQESCQLAVMWSQWYVYS